MVFVSVRGRDAALPRTRRKRALGVADGTTWEAFSALVCTRLSLRGVKGIYHAASGAPLRAMEELQDIEDLEVEARPAACSGSVDRSAVCRARADACALRCALQEVEEDAPPTSGGRGAANGVGGHARRVAATAVCDTRRDFVPHARLCPLHCSSPLDARKTAPRTDAVAVSLGVSGGGDAEEDKYARRGAFAMRVL